MRRACLCVAAAALVACGDDTATDPGAGVGGAGAGAAVGGAGVGGGAGGSAPDKCNTPSDAPYLDPLTYLGRAEGFDFIEILEVVQRHPIVLACTSVRGLNLWDASGEGGPTELASEVAPPGLSGVNGLEHCQHVAIDPDVDEMVMTNRGDEIQPQPFVWLGDFSNPASPQGLAGWTGPESIEGVALRGGRIWAAAHTAGILVLDHTGSGDGGLTEVARFSDASSDAWYPVLHGDYLLVAEGALGLRIYDVSADEPALVASVPIDGSSKHLVVHDDIVYVAASSRIAAIDITDPESPALSSELETAGTAVAVTIGLNDTLLVAEWEKVRGYDISDPQNLRQELSEIPPPKDGALFARVLALAAAPDESRVFIGEWNGLHAYEQVPCGVGPDIETSPDQLSFPTVASGDVAAAALVIRNHGNRPLDISAISATAATLAVAPAALEIAEGEGDFVEVTFQPDSTSELQAMLMLASDDVDQGVFQLRVSGNVPGIDVGDPLPAFDLVDTDGQGWSNADLDGKVAVLSYFATF